MLKLIATGNVGKDAEFKQISESKTLVSFDIANTKTWKNAKGEKQDKTTWVTCNMWGSKEGIISVLKKGKQVLVQGEPDVNAWANKEGKAKGQLIINVSDFELL